MSPLKLKKLPNRETAKITFTASVDLRQMLEAYAKLYEVEYGEREAIADLIPYILEAYVSSDRQFRKATGQSFLQSQQSALKSSNSAS